MRPDEHKKKKNAAYKKKHNIQSGSMSGSSSREKDGCRMQQPSDVRQQTDTTSRVNKCTLVFRHWVRSSFAMTLGRNHMVTYSQISDFTYVNQLPKMSKVQK